MKYLLLPIFFCVSINVRAQIYESVDFKIPKLLTFQQLMYLPAEKRIEYIRDIRLTLAEVEKSIAKSSGGRKSAELEMWKETLQAMLQELGDMALPVAEAADMPCMGTQIRVNGICRNILVPGSACPQGQTPKTVNGLSVCIPSETKARIDDGHKALENRNAPPAVKEQFVDNIRNSDEHRKNPVTLVPPKPPGTSKTEPPVSAAAPGTTAAPPTAAPKVAAPDTKPAAKLPPKDETRFKSGEGKNAELVPEKPETAKPEDTAKTKPSASGSVCKKRNDVRKNFYKEAEAAKAIECFNGGNISEYRDGKIKARNCKNVTEFPTDGPDSEKIKCTSGSMCYPLLYCGPKKGEAFCEKPNEDFTETCETKAAKVKCDPFEGETAIPGAKEKWAAFKEKFDSVCGKKGKVASFREFFCKECELIEKRMQAIEKNIKPYKDRMPSGASDPRVVPAVIRGGGDGGGVRERSNTPIDI